MTTDNKCCVQATLFSAVHCTTAYSSQLIATFSIYRHANWSKQEREISQMQQRCWGGAEQEGVSPSLANNGVWGSIVIISPMFWHISSLKESIRSHKMCYFWWFRNSGISWIPCRTAGTCLESGTIPPKVGRLACLFIWKQNVREKQKWNWSQPNLFKYCHKVKPYKELWHCSLATDDLNWTAVTAAKNKELV